jgi:hypothetical protein
MSSKNDTFRSVSTPDYLKAYLVDCSVSLMVFLQDSMDSSLLKLETYFLESSRLFVIAIVGFLELVKACRLSVGLSKFKER